MNQNNEHHRDDVEELLAQAGPPPETPADDLAAIRAAARREWRSLQAGPATSPSRLTPLLAIAASLLLVVALAWLWSGRQTPRAPESVATFELVRGDASVAAAAAGSSRTPSRGDQISPGSTVQTSTGVVAIELAGGQSVRLDAGTEASIVSASQVRLTHGAVYVDSGPGSASNVEVVTPLGLVTEIGTQFEVRVGNGGGATVRVRVREGSVALALGGESYSAAIGQQLTVDSRGQVFHASVPVRGPEWDWILQAAPGIEIEGRPLTPYLEWISRETGWEIQYEDAELEKAAAIIEAFGSVEGQTPEESLGSILPASGLDYEIRDSVLLIVRPR